MKESEQQLESVVPESVTVSEAGDEVPEGPGELDLTTPDGVDQSDIPTETGLDVPASVRAEFLGGRRERALIGAPVTLDLDSGYSPRSGGGEPELEEGELARTGLIGEGVAGLDALAIPVEGLEEPSEAGEGELDGVLLDEDELQGLDEDQVLFDLAIAAADSGKEFDGVVLAQLLGKVAPASDLRLVIALKVLSLGQKLTGERFLSCLEDLGYERNVLEARETQAELARGGIVGVEMVSGPALGVDGEVLP